MVGWLGGWVGGQKWGGWVGRSALQCGGVRMHSTRLEARARHKAFRPMVCEQAEALPAVVQHPLQGARGPVLQELVRDRVQVLVVGDVWVRAFLEECLNERAVHCVQIFPLFGLLRTAAPLGSLRIDPVFFDCFEQPHPSVHYV